jgi:hypothetical protein
MVTTEAFQMLRVGRKVCGALKGPHEMSDRLQTRWSRIFGSRSKRFAEDLRLGDRPLPCQSVQLLGVLPIELYRDGSREYGHGWTVIRAQQPVN